MKIALLVLVFASAQSFAGSRIDQIECSGGGASISNFNFVDQSATLTRSGHPSKKIDLTMISSRRIYDNQGGKRAHPEMKTEYILEFSDMTNQKITLITDYVVAKLRVPSKNLEAHDEPMHESYEMECYILHSFNQSGYDIERPH